jgi:DNA polymerase delta subunit 2
LDYKLTVYLLAQPAGEWIALVSGLDVGSLQSETPKQAIFLQLLVEFLASELGSSEEQIESSHITRLIIAGDSFTPIELKDDTERLLNPRMERSHPQPVLTGTPPNEILAGYLLDIGRSMPVHIMPGQKDPSAISLPQQPLPRAMLGAVKQLKSFKCETNPVWLSFGGCQ